MKIFDESGNWPTKTNFVDESNRVLGYDRDQNCCEHHDWFISKYPEFRAERYNDPIKDSDFLPKPVGGVYDLPGWEFDPDFFNEGEHSWLDEGGWASFRITNGDDERFIVIYNSHNGYYGHGFNFKIGDDTKQEGCL